MSQRRSQQHGRKARPAEQQDARSQRGQFRQPGEILRRKYALRQAALPRLLSWLGYAWLISIYTAVAVAMAFLGASFYPLKLPDDSALPPTRVYSSDGQLLAKLYREYHVPVTLDELPPYTVHAILAAEDVRFFHHHGLDLRGILRALWVDVRSRRLVQGGSTITQQLVRIEMLDDRRTIPRKMREVVLALRAERSYTKSEILERYLNDVYFGGGAYGIGAAAERYFGKRVEQLTPAESALLAGLIRAPGEGNPRRNQDIATRRQRAILAVMRKNHWIAVAGYRKALNEKIVLKPLKSNTWQHPYVVAEILKRLDASYGEDVIFRGGMVVYTTIDSRLQQAAERALANAVRAGRGRHVGNGGLVAIEPMTGNIRAFVGGVNFKQSQFNRAMQAHRQPGSAFKAFVYQAAIDHGYILSDLELDAPVTVGNWKPKNYGNSYHGVVTLRTALALSLNSVAVRLTRDLSPYAVIAAAHDAGITSPLQPNMAIALGASEVTPLEMARAFATYANEGYSMQPRLIAQILYRGQLVYRDPVGGRQSVRATTAFQLTQGLEGVIQNGTGRRANIGRPAAGKTGTSSDFRDAWFIGYTPNLCAAVWMGNDDHSPMFGVAGGSLPAQAWAEFMSTAHRNVPVQDFIVPSGIVPVRLCAQSGLLALPTCPQTVVVDLPIDRVPTELCPLHYWVTRDVCAVTGLLPNSTCPKVSQTFVYNQLPDKTCPIDHTHPSAPPEGQLEPPTPVPAPQPAPTQTEPQPSTPVPSPAPSQPPSTQIPPRIKPTPTPAPSTPTPSSPSTKPQPNTPPQTAPTPPGTPPDPKKANPEDKHDYLPWQLHLFLRWLWPSWDSLQYK